MDEIVDSIGFKDGSVSKSDYVKALRLIGSCRADRLPYVVEALQNVGFVLPDVTTLDTLRRRKRARTQRCAVRRTSEEKFLETDDEVALALRDAYRKGASLIAIGDECDMNRVCLYQYMVGTRQLKSPQLRARVIDAVVKVLEDLENCEGH